MRDERNEQVVDLKTETLGEYLTRNGISLNDSDDAVIPWLISRHRAGDNLRDFFDRRNNIGAKLRAAVEHVLKTEASKK